MCFLLAWVAASFFQLIQWVEVIHPLRDLLATYQFKKQPGKIQPHLPGQGKGGWKVLKLFLK